MRTYRDLFGLSEFRALFGVSCVRYAGGTMEGIALGTLVYSRTGSPLLSALSMFGPSAAQVLGAATLLSWADRVRPRAALVGIGTVYAFVALLLVLPLPVCWLLSVSLVGGLVGAVGGGVQWGLVREVVPADGYLLARSAFTVAVGLMQIVGFGIGGVLANVIGARPTLLVAAALYAGSAVVSRIGLVDRPSRAVDKASVRATWRDNRFLLGTPERRALYAAMWLPNGLVVGCEALFIPLSPRWAGFYLSTAALGMLAGDVLVARVLGPRSRGWLAPALRLLLAAPYLPFVFGLPVAAAAAAVCVASVGYAAGLLLQQRLIALTPEHLVGHALGLHSSGMLTMQAVAASAAGALAEVVAPATAMTVFGAVSILVTLALTPRLRAGDRWLAAERYGASVAP
ncbi:MFS transporter [uncultured Jatrophihabitans sp.]|uniref:MFS transporter n=1 Tax=uncultured Jatrophihabitans sp. TaxID=1610747 RepID=UPI0035C9E5D7